MFKLCCIYEVSLFGILLLLACLPPCLYICPSFQQLCNEYHRANLNREVKREQSVLSDKEKGEIPGNESQSSLYQDISLDILELRGGQWPRVKDGLTEVCGWSRSGLDKYCDHWPSSYKYL